MGSNLLEVPHPGEITVLARSAAPIGQIRDGIEHILGDVRLSRFRKRRYTHVIHAAGSESGVEGTRNVLKTQAERFLYISSGAALFDHNDYCKAKRASENLVLEAGGIIARCYTFVGPHMQFGGRFAAGNFIKDAVENNRIVIKGSGKAVRSYLYSHDMAEWLWELLMKGTPGCIYNVGSHIPVTINMLAREVAHLVALKLERPYIKIETLNGNPDALGPDEYLPSIYQRNGGPKLVIKTPWKDALSKTIGWYVKTQTSSRQGMSRGECLTGQ